VMDRLEQRIPSAVRHQLVVETSAQAQEDVVAAVDRLRSDKTMRVRLTGWEAALDSVFSLRLE